eukprot:9201305-Pyramimonas_sp.AAC.1
MRTTCNYVVCTANEKHDSECLATIADVHLVAPTTPSAWKGYYSFLERLGTHPQSRLGRLGRTVRGARGVSAQT